MKGREVKAAISFDQKKGGKVTIRIRGEGRKTEATWILHAVAKESAKGRGRTAD